MEKTVMPDRIKIDIGTFSNIMNFTCSYHPKEDVLFLSPRQPIAATSVDVDGEFWIRINPVSGELVGIEIEDFEKIYIQKNPELVPAWKTIGSLCRGKRQKELSGNPALKIILNHFKTLVQDAFRQNPSDLIKA